MSAPQAQAVVDTIAPLLKRRRYEQGHWDAVISNYKEIEVPPMDVLSCLYDIIDAHITDWLPLHAIDLHAEGRLDAHVDSVRYSGDIVAGLSLLTPSILRLRPADTDGTPMSNGDLIDLLLPERSLYVLRGIYRYEYTHELLPSGAVFAGTPVMRDRRISIIFRNAVRTLSEYGARDYCIYIGITVRSTRDGQILRLE